MLKRCSEQIIENVRFSIPYQVSNKIKIYIAIFTLFFFAHELSIAGENNKNENDSKWIQKINHLSQNKKEINSIENKNNEEILIKNYTVSNLNQAIQQAILINPIINSAAAKLRKSDINIDIEKNSYYPGIQTSVGSGRINKPHLNYEVTVTQMLYDWGAVESKVHSAEAEQKLNAQELLIARENSAIEITELYFDIFFSNEKIKVITASLERLQELLEISEKRVESTYSDRSEKTRVSLEISKTQDFLINEKRKFSETQRKFQVLTGGIQVSEQPIEAPSLQQLLDDGKHLPYLVQSSPLYLQSLEKKNIEEAKLRTADAALKPQLNLEGSTLRRDIGGVPTRDSTISVQFRMPFTQGFSNFQRRDAIREAIEAAHWDIEAASRDITLKVLMLMEAEAPMQARLIPLQSQITSSQELKELYQEQFLIGLRNMSDLLTVATNQFEAQRQLIEIRSEQQRLTYRAMAHLGLLIPMMEERIHEKIPR